jgi:polyhydroxyalkanoate synthase
MPLINRETMLDLQPVRISVVKNFPGRRHRSLHDRLGLPQTKGPFLTIDDHVNGYMNNIIDFIREKHNVPKVISWVYAWGRFCVMYSSLHPDKIKNLVTTVTPSSFDTDKGLLHVWMKDIDVDGIIRTYGNIPGDLMNLDFFCSIPRVLMIRTSMSAS